MAFDRSWLTEEQREQGLDQTVQALVSRIRIEASLSAIGGTENRKAAEQLKFFSHLAALSLDEQLGKLLREMGAEPGSADSEPNILKKPWPPLKIEVPGWEGWFEECAALIGDLELPAKKRRTWFLPNQPSLHGRMESDQKAALGLFMAQKWMECPKRQKESPFMAELPLRALEADDIGISLARLCLLKGELLPCVHQLNNVQIQEWIKSVAKYQREAEQELTSGDTAHHLMVQGARDITLSAADVRRLSKRGKKIAEAASELRCTGTPAEQLQLCAELNAKAWKGKGEPRHLNIAALIEHAPSSKSAVTEVSDAGGDLDLSGFEMSPEHSAELQQCWKEGSWPTQRFACPELKLPPRTAQEWLAESIKRQDQTAQAQLIRWATRSVIQRPENASAFEALKSFAACVSRQQKKQGEVRIPERLSSEYQRQSKSLRELSVLLDSLIVRSIKH